MNAIHIEAEDWLMTAALIGVVRLFENEDLITSSGVKLEKHHLKEIPKKYFDYLLTHFSIVDRDVDRMKWQVNRANIKPEQVKDCAKEIRKIMGEQAKKVEKYFADTDEAVKLKTLLDNLKAVKAGDDGSVIAEAVHEYKQIMSTPFINEKLTLNYVKAVILGPLYGQPSFLQPSFNAKTREAHEQQFYKDFVYAAELDFEFYEQVKDGYQLETLLPFLEEREEYKPFKDWLKKLKKMSSAEVLHAFFTEEQLPCSFVEGFIATQSFEEMVFSPLALSKEKAANFNWNFNRNTPVPISGLARLLLFLVPIGLTTYTRKVGSTTSGETLRFSGLILSQQLFPEIVKHNEQLFAERQKKGTTFGEAIVTVLADASAKAKKKSQSYMYVEFFSNYQAKKTLLDYYHMPGYLVNYLNNHGHSIFQLKHAELRDRFVRMLMKGIDTKQVVFDYIRTAIKEPFHAVGAFSAVKERKRLNEAKKGVSDLTNLDKDIKSINSAGAKLRHQYVRAAKSTEEKDVYKASGQKKLESIAYRLLNSVKAGNRHAFMDTVFRMYMGTGLTIPTIFTDINKEQGLDFETIASAFITGLLAEDRSNSKEEAKANG
ncbi:type I-B CRISPR-associated protein Cas8b1/Cst1 [Halalkalibacterium halodurans]|uniref:type I-B CRISPR-associated protein Cas8b1/Cst1 n=2 Tax=Halalkalibacterium halodurans TaxID=86665 RepID=UPI002AA9F469|nr:type I-B CRISPR-associated protein Cas8b1/Cst1 [Halalkalibacterium halodurans]MDY7220841.1 type I-B CRISPR-associated protein Cas8b1/Cst1 [Halalkalibacterium halodurans]MDY7240080.1 type I-B CRISPR-associated protein Cas8b1/Cst1 [Halalkalibacterium halodurans]MED4083219.1 type I-B CRISPR-associated protein Cas8b1/Cst1 [Halalkalibacterium halodurans]MED4087073.1 type I-B CRISPR-associated protein Cas8b1/Cst1 [Halalkalibacterium halodurans]MED4105946.1 type I-B CRISPR-associated protein Cas8b